MARAVARGREVAHAQIADLELVAVAERVVDRAGRIREVRREDPGLLRGGERRAGVVGSSSEARSAAEKADPQPSALAVARRAARMVRVVVGEQQPGIRAGSRPAARTLARTRSMPSSRAHAAVDQRELAAAVEQVDVGVEVGGEPEAGERSATDEEDVGVRRIDARRRVLAGRGRDTRSREVLRCNVSGDLKHSRMRVRMVGETFF